MSRAYDPIYQLAAREAVRFIGTVGDIVADICPLLCSIAKSFDGREVRAESDLIETIQLHRVANKKDRSTAGVAKHTLEVASHLRILEPIPISTSRSKKYALGRSGRVLLAMTTHKSWNATNAALAIRRPMFEYNGDYLLQALVTIDTTSLRNEQLSKFALLVRELTAEKLAELPVTRSGLNWNIYVQELTERQWWMKTQTSESNSRPSLADLKRARMRTAAASQKASSKSETANKSESKTFEHHFVRCRSWLNDLGLIIRTPEGDRLNDEGSRVLRYFVTTSATKHPPRIPPTASLLQDALSLSQEQILESWGAVVDDSFWEEGLYNLDRYGTYEPTFSEFKEVFSWAFDRVKFQRVSEAPLPAMRDVIFLSFLWADKPLRPRQISQLIDTILQQLPDTFGVGKNRQGRMAFVFRKKSAG